VSLSLQSVPSGLNYISSDAITAAAPHVARVGGQFAGYDEVNRVCGNVARRQVDGTEAGRV